MKVLPVALLAFLAFCGAATAQSILNRFGAKVPNEGVFRSCEISVDCAPTTDCSAKSGTDCNVSQECRRCIKMPFGGTTCLNDPSCEVNKSVRRAQCDAEAAARKADCEVNKSAGKLKCEANKAAAKSQCEAMREDEISKSKQNLQRFTADVPNLKVQTLKTSIEAEGSIASVLGLKDLSDLDFVFVAPETKFRAVLAHIRYGEALVSMSAIPSDLFWIGPRDAISYRNLTVFAYDRDVSVRDIVRAAIVAELFKLSPDELAQLSKSSAFDFNDFVNQAADQICGNESLLDKGLECKRSASFR
jgi:hypothetical protein